MTAGTVADLKPYPAYKPSGVEWLGEVPAHWEVRRLKYVVTLVMGQSPPGETCSDKPIGLPFLQGCAEFGERHPSPTQFCHTPQKESPIGAILLSVRAPVGRLNIADQAYGIGRGLCAISPHRKFLQTKFAYYQLEVLGYGLRLVSTGSTYDAVSVGDVGNQPSILPPLAEQTAIVRYLDHADRLIHRYISAKQRLVSLLEEQRRATVHHAVTRGLDPDVHLKPSGIPRLGHVPTHWELMPLKRLGRFRSGSGFPIDEQGEQDLELPFFKVSDMNLPGNGKVVTIQNNSVSQRTAKRLGATVFPAGTIIFPKVGGALLTNKRRLVERPCCIDNNLMGCVVRCGNPQFVLLLLGHIDLATIAKPGPVPAVNEGEVREIRTAVPPLPEQNAIVAHLDKAMAEIDSAIARVRRQVELLHEYRTRLIADVVTGKLDVREAAAKLQNTPLEPTDESEGLC